MNFKEFIFTEEINPNDTATVYHRTKSLPSVSNILQSGFTPGAGDYYGKGLYTTISLESQFNQGMLKYGSIIVKFHVTNLDKYLVFQPNIAKRIHGQNSYKLSDQLKKFGLYHKFQPEYLSELDQQQELTGLTDAENLKKFYDQNYWIQNDPSIKGVIYYGTNDGYCLLKYEPVNDGTITMLAYARADTNLETMQKLYNNEGWITSTDRLKIKQIEQLPYDQRSSYAQISELNFKTPLELYRFLMKNDLDLSQLGLPKIKFIENIIQKNSPLSNKIIDFLINRSRSHDKNASVLLDYASDKQKMAKLIIQNKKEITDIDVSFLIHFASDKQEIAKLIIKNKKELSDDNVDDLIRYASDPEEIAKLIIQNKKELSDYSFLNLLRYASDHQEMAKFIIQNKEELTDKNVDYLLKYASDHQEMAKFIIQNKKELSNGNVESLLINQFDPQEIAKLIIQNKKELSNYNVSDLLNYASDKQEIASLLGSININKLSDNYVHDLIRTTFHPEEIAQIIDRYHTNKTPEIQNLIKPYLQQNT